MDNSQNGYSSVGKTGKLRKMKDPEKPFGCTICNTAFTQLELLGKHVETLHSSKQSKNSKVQSTLEYPISMGVRLLIFPKFSTQHALIPYHTFINFMKKFQPKCLFHIVCFFCIIFFP